MLAFSPTANPTPIMPIKFNCACGKTLQVKDEFAGRRVKCPACSAVATVPAADPGFEVVNDPGFEVVDTPAAPPPVQSAIPRAMPVARTGDDRPRQSRDEDDNDTPQSRRRDEDEDDRPRKKRRDDDDDERPRKKKKFNAAKAEREESGGHFRMEKGIVNSGVLGGTLAMIGAIVWFVLGLMADRIFFYPPILFIAGLVAFCKGLMGGGSDD